MHSFFATHKIELFEDSDNVFIYLSTQISHKESDSTIITKLTENELREIDKEL